jgi:hypothetical protein
MSTMQTKTGAIPFPRTVDEWVGRGYSQDQALHKVRADVFGHDYKLNPKTNQPIEQGRGAPGRETQQHRAALERARDFRRPSSGWGPGLEGSFDPKKGN